MHHSCIRVCISLIVYVYHAFTGRCVMMLSATLHRMRVWPVSSLQMVSFHDWPLHSMRTVGTFSNRVTISQGSIQVLCNAWNLVASGVMSLFNVFLHTITLWDSDMHGFVTNMAFQWHLLTCSLLSPSSWYDVDYSVASPLRFGQCLGCDFAEESCFSHG